jgi:hypothetical protein
MTASSAAMRPQRLLALRGDPDSTAAVYVATQSVRSVEWIAIDDDGALPAAGSTVAGSEVVIAMRVETVEHWDDDAGPGIVRLAFVAGLPTVSREQFIERYLGHAPIARVQHPGIVKYVQHFVVDSTDADCLAVAELHFADAESMRTRFYRDANSPAVVDADIGDYLDRGRTWSLVATPAGSA